MKNFYALLAVLMFAFLHQQTNARTFTDTCRADFEKVNTTNSLLTNGFHAIPWNGSDKKPEEICWSFGDNSDTCIKYDPALSNNYYVAHTYSHAGSYNVCVRILYQGGCLSYKCKTMQLGVGDSCSAKFETVASTSTSFGKYFIAQPFNSQHKKPLKVCWSFGDDRDTCITYATTYTASYGAFHLYNHPGTYNVCVKILYDGGCESHYCNSIIINSPVADSCKADFEKLSAAINNPLRAYYRALPWNNNNKAPEQICWNFGDNHDTCIKYNFESVNNYIAAHTYEHTGTYNVCVKIQYHGGCVSYKCKTIQIGEADSCHANFETFSSTATSHGKYFAAQPWHNNNKKPVLICWKFGDNLDTCIQYSTTYTGRYAVFHSYPNAGSYNVCVKITYDGGCESYYCKTLQLDFHDTCQADFEVNSASSTIQDRHLTALSNDHEKKPQHICWTFGDGRDTCIAYAENYTGNFTIDHHYYHTGIYEACVKINYYGGCEAKKCKIINIIAPNYDTCNVHLFEITSSANNLTRGFYFNSSNNTTPAHICWNFGDGTDTCISVEPGSANVAHSINHIYPSPGVYKACIKLLFQNGCTAGDCHEVLIKSLSDICGGYYTDSLINSNTYVLKAFSIHKATDAVASYRWTFGDGSTEVGEQTTHTYAAAGTYRVCLLINTQKGCETKICNDLRTTGTHQTILQLSPNPVSDVLHALFYSAYNEAVTIKISNSNGVVVKTYTRTASTGSNIWDFENANLVPGTYLFTVLSASQFASDIFFKL